MAASGAPLATPDYITYLFSPKPKFDCYFVVGNKSLGKTERIGAVKLMLMAHSEVMRMELEDSDLAEKGDVNVEDIYPDTFKTLLKFMYGYDTTGDLPFDEADNMFYAAEKYMMPILKKRLAVRLIALLNPNNVCLLLNNPACYTQLELNAAITQILRYETDSVLASPNFLDVSAEGFLSILRQDGLAVPEIELWKAAVKWAKHQADSEDEKVVRQQLSLVSKSLRICTLSGDQLCQEVVPTKILSSDEVGLVCQSIGMKKKNDDLIEFCNDLEPRKRFRKPINLCRSRDCILTFDVQPHHELTLGNELRSIMKCSLDTFSNEYKFEVLTKKFAVEFLPLECVAQRRGLWDPVGWTYTMNCTIKITEQIGPKTVSDVLLTLIFTEDVEYGSTFKIPLAIDGNNVTLPPNSKYIFTMQLVGNHMYYYKSTNLSYASFNDKHFNLKLYSIGNSFAFPSYRLCYKIVPQIDK